MGTAPPLAPYEVPDVEQHSGSAPPSPPPPPPERHGTGRYAAVNEDTAGRALRISLSNREAIGMPPDPSARPPFLGSGMRRTLAEILGELAEIKAIVLRGETSRAAVSSRAWWAVWIVVAVLLGIMTTAAVSVAARVRIVSAEQTRGDVLGQR